MNINMFSIPFPTQASWFVLRYDCSNNSNLFIFGIKQIIEFVVMRIRWYQQ
jgi:hypothetical protein